MSLANALQQINKPRQIEPQPVDKKTSKLISELLDSANTHMEFEHVILPPVSNAVENLNRTIESRMVFIPSYPVRKALLRREPA